MREALATLPWVEQDTIELDFKARELKFRVQDKAQFNEAQIKQALKAQGFANVEVRSAPS